MKTNQTNPIGILKFSVRCRMLNVLLVPYLCLTAGSAFAEVHYVDVNGTNATPPYTNWTTAATNIQDAVEATTNLGNANWVPLQSLNLTNGAFYFSDPNWTNYPVRLYRVRSP